MAGSCFKPFLIALALVPAACDARHDDRAQSSVTVALPPATKATPRPGFSLEATTRPAQSGDERATQAVHELAASIQ